MTQLATKLLHLLSPECAHSAAITALRALPVKNIIADLDTSMLAQELLGRQFAHPLGLAAGFDKHAEVFDKLGQLGFSFLEIGSITPQPQPGNPKPRLFRLTEQQAIINRYGFNSKGADYAFEQLKRYPHTCITGVNLGKNKTSTNAIDDFLSGAKKFISVADYFTINVSSPNTPGLRDLQTAEVLKPMIDGIRAIMLENNRVIPLLVKLSPDMSIEQESALIEFLVDIKVSGIIISNTTTSRAGVENNPLAAETGGLSGPPLKARTLAMVQRVYAITRGKTVLIGCGGISSGADAYEMLRSGANLLQIYTAFIYQGPEVIRRIILELKSLLARDGVKHLGDLHSELSLRDSSRL